MGKRTGSSNKATPASIVLGLVVLGAVWLLLPAKPGSVRDAPPTSDRGLAGASDATSAPSSPGRADLADRASATGTETSLTIASWNIEWLGRPGERSGAGRGVAQDPADLAAAITRSGASIVALQEISPTGSNSPEDPRSSELDAVASRLGAGWEYVLFPSRSGDQFTGFLWNEEHVTPVADRKDVSWRLPVPTRWSSQGSGLWVRPPTAVKFTTGAGRTDFVLVVVHMKADYQGNFARHRAEEADVLAAVLPDVRRALKDQDVVVLGDTNIISDNEPAEQTIERAGLRDLDTSNAATHWRGGGMDKIFVPIDQPEFAGATLRIINHDTVLGRTMSPAAYKRRFSDHYMVTTTVRVQDDDD